MAKKDFTLTSKILIALLAFENAAAGITGLSYRKKPWELAGLAPDRQKRMIYYLMEKGWIRKVDKNAERFYALTRKGELEALLAKARLPDKGKWDGKWRIIVFDIPEDHKEKRNLLRLLLKKNNFYPLQASVYVNPYPLNREAIQYLQETGLNHYIRIMKVEEMDSDQDLKKYFHLI